MSMSDSESRIESIEKIVRAEEEIKMGILDEFSGGATKKVEGYKQENKRFNNPKGNEERQNKPN